MPKLKTKSGAKKRFKITGTGKVKYAQAGKRHGMIKRTNKQIRNLRGTTTPEAVKAKTVKFRPVGSMPVRSFIVTPDETVKAPAGLPLNVQGLAMSGRGAVTKVEVSTDGVVGW